jgi:hypothetical protein
MSIKLVFCIISFINVVTKVERMSVQAFGSMVGTILPSPMKMKMIQRKFNVVLSATYDNDEDEDDTQGSLTPSQLEQLLQNSRPSTSANSNNGNEDSIGANDRSSRIRQATEAEIDAAEQIAGNVSVPKTGISVSDEMSEIQSNEKFVSKLFPLDVSSSGNNQQQTQQDSDGESSNDIFSSVAAIQTVTSDSIGDEPMRYIVALDQYDDNDQNRKYAMIDVPPYSDDLAEQIKEFMTRESQSENEDENSNTGTLSTILITCRDGIHYDETPAVYVTRKSDMIKWKQAFPDAEIVMYRLDTPRDCKDSITQSLDGYGPWALDDSVKSDENNEKELTAKFIETGRPLTRMEWDEETQVSVLDNGEVPPDDEGGDNSGDDVDVQYTPHAIKKREENKDILAIYTPGHTYGSVSYIFPKLNVCCSGYTIPVEDTRSNANIAGLTSAGPALDYRGYITTNSGGIDRQIESARGLVKVYADRFGALLPSRGPPVTLGHLPLVERQRILYEMLDEYAELGRVYESMGII